MLNTPLVPMGSTPGLNVTLATANTESAGVAIPTGAKGVLLWFEASSSSSVRVAGRILFNASSGAVTPTTANMGYHPDVPFAYQFPAGLTHLHGVSPTAGAILKGSWLASS